MNNEQIAIIDKWLKILNEIGDEFHLTRVYQEHTGIDVGANRNETGFLIMKSLLVNQGLIEAKPTNTFDAPERLTPLGKDIADSGGWKIYFKRQEYIKQVIEEDRKLTRQLAKSTLRLNKFTVVATIVTIAVAMFASWIAYEQLNNDRQRQASSSAQGTKLPVIQKQLQPTRPMHSKAGDTSLIK